MTYQQKLDSARTLIEQHNSNVPAEVKGGRVNFDQFVLNLTEAGGTNESALAQSSWEDLQDFGLPKLLARQVAAIFRSKEEKKEEKPVLKRSKVEAMSVAELVTHYDPRTPTNLVTERLESLLGTKKFVVFNTDGTVNTTVSTKLATEILDGYPERELYNLNDDPTKVYRLNERPDQSFNENPLYPGRILRPDGDCDQTNRSWAGVPLEVKQVLYLAVKGGEVKINAINDAHTIIDLALQENALKNIKQRFPKSGALLKELQQQGQAPMLKIFKKMGSESLKKNDPFGQPRTY